jgi:MinD-like ATPase involved in chromosome partitioning or flagellar assembly
MVVITIASRKGGSGKSTLTANLAAFAVKVSRRCLLIDADPQGSLSLWHELRKSGEPPLRTAVRGVENIVTAAKRAGFEWVFIDTPPQISGIVNDAIRAATLVVIPARPSVLDLDAVKETIAYTRERRKPYAIVLNGAPPKREGAESPLCTHARQSLEGIARASVVRPDHPPHHLFVGFGPRQGRARARCGVRGGLGDRPPVQLGRTFGEGDPT